MPDLTTAEMRARLEELCEDLRRLATMPPLQRIGNVGMRIVIGEQWILDLALETLARREREEVAEAQARYAKCQHVWIEEYYGYKCNGCDSFHAYGTAPWEAPIEQR